MSCHHSCTPIPPHRAAFWGVIEPSFAGCRQSRSNFEYEEPCSGYLAAKKPPKLERYGRELAIRILR
jgi:hypothetical protein